MEQIKMKIKKHMSIFLAVLMIGTALPLSIFATDIAENFLTGTDAVKTNTDANEVYEGVCGDNLTWTLDKNGTLVISGEGEITSNPWNSSKVKKVIISEGVTAITESMFGRCINLVEVSLPDSITKIGITAFANCTSLENITIPSNVKVINEGTFFGCSNLKNVFIPSSVTYIDIWAFWGTSLETIHFLGTEDAWECIRYDDIENEELVNADKHFCVEKEEIEPTCVPGHLSGWFCYECDEYIISGNEIPPTLAHNYEDGLLCSVCGEKCKHTDIDENGCSECKSTDVCGENAYWTLDENGTLTISGTGEMFYYGECCTPWWPHHSEIYSVIIEDGITKVVSDSFGYCEKIRTVFIGSDVEFFDMSALWGCTDLETITVDEDNQYYSSDEYGIFFNKNKTTLIQCPAKNPVTEYVVPDSVTLIGLDDEPAFCGNDNITKVIISDNVKIVNYYAFEGCSNLEEILFPTSIEKISWGVLNYCDKLEYIHYFGTAEQWKAAQIYSEGDYQFYPEDKVLVGELHCVTRIDATTSSCGVAGKTAGVYCAECDRYIYGGETTEKADHTYIDHTAKAPTCTEFGWEAYETCENCDYTTYEEIPSLGHDMGEFVRIKDATCTEAGIERADCTRCDHYETRVSETDGHGYMLMFRDPTCTEPGITRHYCYNCGYEYFTDEVPALGHSFTNYEISSDATCINDGLEIANCDNDRCFATDWKKIEKHPDIHQDNNNDGKCDHCAKILREEPADNSFFGKIKAFFQRIIDWFRNLFK